MHSLKKGITDGFLAKSDATAFPPSACGKIALENSVVHGALAHPSSTHAAARYTAAIAATYALLLYVLLPAQPEPFLLSLFFFFSFFIFLFSIGTCNERMARIEKDEVTYWLWK